MAFMVKLGETRLPFSTKGRGCHGDGFHHDLQRFWGVFPSGDHTGRLTTPEASRGRQELGFAQLSIDPSSKKGSTVPPSPATNNSPVEGQPPWCHSPGSGAVLFGSHASNWGYTVSSPPSNGNLWNPPNRMCYCVLYLSIHPSIYLSICHSILYLVTLTIIHHHSPSFTIIHRPRSVYPFRHSAFTMVPSRGFADGYETRDPSDSNGGPRVVPFLVKEKSSANPRN